MIPPPAGTDAILAAVEGLARDHLGELPEVRRDSRLVEDLELDSVGLLTLAVAVEDHFRIALDEEDEAAIRTVGDLVDVVARKLS